jgi:hypothetical protein
MTKAEILRAIVRIAKANGGKAPGSQLFETVTGMKTQQWYPRLWLRWAD